MSGPAISMKCALVVIAMAFTFLHQRLMVDAWPGRSMIASAFLATPTVIVLTICFGALVLSSLRSRSVHGTEGRRAPILILPLLVSLFMAAVVRLDERPSWPPGHWYSPGTLGYLLGALSIFVSVATFIAWRSPRSRPQPEALRSWGPLEWLLSALVALNIFFISLSEVRFVTTSESVEVASSDLSRLFFGLRYSDVSALRLNPIFDVMKLLLSSFTPAHFLTQMACVYIMAISIAFFSLTVSRVVGYVATFVLASGLAWSKAIVLVVTTGTNIVTLFLAATFSLWVLSRVFLVVSTPRAAVERAATGLLVGVALTLSLYTYAPSRMPCFVFAGVGMLSLLWGALRDAERRVGYIAALVAAFLAPASILIGQYDGDLAAFTGDFRRSVLPVMSTVLDSRPTFVRPESETSTPDLPLIYGAVAKDVPQLDGSTTKEWVCWRRSPGELLWVLSKYLGQVFKKYQPFPGGAVWWFFGVIGLVVSIRMMPSKRDSRLYVVSALLLSLTLVSPFLLVTSLFEWRRGVGVVLVFASFAGLGIYYVLRLCAPRASSAMLSVVVGVMIFLVLGKSSIRAIAATPFPEVGIFMPCRASYLKTLVEYARLDARMTGKLHVIGSKTDECAYSISRELARGLGESRVKLLPPTALSLNGLRETLSLGDSVMIECGEWAAVALKDLCTELRGDSNARSVYYAPQDMDDLWVYTR